ncbi:MAG: tetratricopeptide repeat protein [Bryobacteraceae bacterium]
MGPRFLCIFFILLNICAAYWSIRLARADILSQEDSISSRQAATDLTPGDAKCWIRLAHLQEQRGRDALPSFSRAAAANDLSAEAWIGMGLEQEVAGQVDLAQKCLLHAAELSKEYVPRSTLANFYFRRNDPAHFWPWAKQALAVASGDQQSIFRMCWGLSSDPDEIARNVLPDGRLILRQYAIWLTTAGKLQAAAPIAIRLLAEAKDDDLPSLLYYCDSQIAKGHIGAAEAVWAQLLSKHLLPAAEDSSATGLVNGQFIVEPMNSGFDWRLPPAGGVTIRRRFPGLRIMLSGSQPESCMMLLQYIPIESGRHYRLWYEYQTADIPPGSGLAWRVYDVTGRVEFIKDSPSLAREQMGRESLTFVTPSNASGGLLALTYNRVPGTTRISGWLQLKQAGLEATK